MSVDWGELRLIVFDLDDTLCSERDYHFDGFAAVAAAFGPRFEPPFDMAARMRELFDTGDRGVVFDTVLSEMGVQPTPALLGEMVHVHRERPVTLAPYPDVPDALDRLAEVVRLGLISDGWLGVQRKKVAATGVDRWIKRVILTDELGRDHWKPALTAFEMMEISAGARGGQCAYVGDNPAKDFVAPNALGWVSVQIRRADALYVDQPVADGGEPAVICHRLGSLVDAVMGARG